MTDTVSVNAMGDACPIPVVKTLKALNALAGAGTVVTSVDNEIAVKNLTKMGEDKGCSVDVEKVADHEWHVSVSTEGAVDVADADADAAAVCDVPAKGDTIVVVNTNVMGHGDETLGKNLLKAFIFSITQLDELPATMLFYNGGAHLTCEGSESLDDIRGLAAQGVEILTCGTCLKFYGIEDKLAVGEATNMYVIVEKQQKAARIIRP